MTTHEARARVLALIAREPPRPDDGPQVVGWLRRLCRAAAAALPAAGVGLSVMAEGGGQLAIAASSDEHARVEELQFILGEGPCLAAYKSGGPVLVTDIAEAARERWPGYGTAVQQYAVRAVFAFPLQMGAARLGALDVYQDTTGPLPRAAIAHALTFAEVAFARLLNAHEESQSDGASTGDLLGDGRAELYQAQGILMVQLGISLTEAMTRLRAYAFAHDLPLSEVAADVVAHRIVIERDSDR